MDFTDDEWEFESFEDGFDGDYDEREFVEDDTEDSADWPDEMCGEDE
jgi:hypothetical protein